MQVSQRRGQEHSVFSLAWVLVRQHKVCVQHPQIYLVHMCCGVMRVLRVSPIQSNTMGIPSLKKKTKKHTSFFLGFASAILRGNIISTLLYNGSRMENCEDLTRHILGFFTALYVKDDDQTLSRKPLLLQHQRGERQPIRKRLPCGRIWRCFIQSWRGQSTGSDGFLIAFLSISGTS